VDWQIQVVGADSACLGTDRLLRFAANFADADRSDWDAVVLASDDGKKHGSVSAEFREMRPGKMSTDASLLGHPCS
jgi:hypothetical protein